VTFHWAARTIDAWLAAVEWLRRTWRILPGDLLGFMVMRGSGVRKPNRTAAEGDVTALLVEDPRVGRYLDTGAMPIYAQTLGRYIFCRGPIDERILAHEMEHVRQWQRLGPLFLPAYFASSGLALVGGRHPYRANRYEEAARRRELEPPAAPSGHS
jgi:hypothetical protein